MWRGVASREQANLLVLALAIASAYKRNIRGVASLICFAVAKRISSCASSSIYCEAGLQWAIGGRVVALL